MISSNWQGSTASRSSHSAETTNAGGAPGCQGMSCGLSMKEVVILNITAVRPGTCGMGAESWSCLSSCTVPQGQPMPPFSKHFGVRAPL